MQPYEPNMDDINPDEMDLGTSPYAGGGLAGNRTMMRLLAAMVVLIVLFVAWKVAVPSYSLDGWHHNIDSALDEAEMSGRPIYILYTADWCPPCRQFKSSVLADSEIASYLESNYVRVKIDLSDRFGENNRIADKYSVHAVPTMMIYSDTGQEIDRHQGGMDRYVFLDWIQQNEVISRGY